MKSATALAERIVQKLLASPEGRAAIQEEADRVGAERQALADELAAATAAYTERRTEIQCTLTEKEERWRSAREAERAALVDMERTRADLRGASFTFDRTRARLEAALRATASPRIDQFRQELAEHRDELREHRQGGRAHLEAIDPAIAAAELLKLEVLTDQQLEDRLAQISAAIPPVSQTW